jgi:hypothetical protein
MRKFEYPFIAFVLLLLSSISVFADCLDLKTNTSVIAYWSFDSDATDDKGWSCGGGCDGTLRADAVVSSDDSVLGGSSLKLDGTGDYVTIPHHVDFNQNNRDFTISCWVKNTGSGEDTIYSKDTSADNVWRMGYKTTTKPYAYGKDDGAQNTTTYYDILHNTDIGADWVLFTMSIDVSSPSGARLYINDTMVAHGNPVAVHDDIDNTVNVTIGGMREPSINNWEGYIDDCLLFNGSLNQVEISALWNNGAGNNPLTCGSTTPALEINTDMANGTNSTTADLQFFFNGTVTNNSNLYNCSLLVDSTINQTSQNIDLTVNQNFSIVLNPPNKWINLTINCSNANASDDASYLYLAHYDVPVIDYDALNYGELVVLNENVVDIEEGIELIAIVMLWLGLWIFGFYAVQMFNDFVGFLMITSTIPIDIYFMYRFQESLMTGTGWIGVMFGLMVMFTLASVFFIRRRTEKTNLSV